MSKNSNIINKDIASLFRQSILQFKVDDILPNKTELSKKRFLNKSNNNLANDMKILI